MKLQEKIDFNRIAAAIGYLKANFRSQPALEEVAGQVHLSPAHFQRMFTEWAGTSPKKFLQFLSVEHAKRVLEQRPESPLPEVTDETGLSSTSRLHDLFVTIEGMTPAEYRDGGRDLSVNYSFADSPFGRVIAASTEKGICYMAFIDGEEAAEEDLRSKFPNAEFRRQTDRHQQNALRIFRHDWSRLDEVRLHLKGTDFQLKVWECLLKIPMGGLTTYGAIAGGLGNPGAARAVGTAVGSNPVAFLIPCHRVIQSSGIFGGYMWGPARKEAMIGWEGARAYAEV